MTLTDTTTNTNMQNVEEKKETEGGRQSLAGDLQSVSLCLCVLTQLTNLLCPPPLQKKGKMHYQIAVIINFLGHCISMVALLIAFFLFLCLRWVLFFFFLFYGQCRGVVEEGRGHLRGGGNIILEASLM